MLLLPNHPEIPHLQSIGRHLDAWLLRHFYYFKTSTVEGLVILRLRNLVLVVIGALIFVRTTRKILGDSLTSTLVGISAATVPALSLAVITISHTHQILGFLVSTLSFSIITSMALSSSKQATRVLVVVVNSAVVGTLGVLLYWFALGWVFYLPILISAAGISQRVHNDRRNELIRMYLVASSTSLTVLAISAVLFIRIGPDTYTEYRDSLSVLNKLSHLNFGSFLELLATSITTMAAVNHYPWLILFLALPLPIVIHGIRSRINAIRRSTLASYHVGVVAFFTVLSLLVTTLLNFNSNMQVASRFLYISNTTMAIVILVVLGDESLYSGPLKFKHASKISQLSFASLILVSGNLMQENSVNLSQEKYFADALALTSEDYPSGDLVHKEAYTFTFYESRLPLIYGPFPLPEDLRRINSLTTDPVRSSQNIYDCALSHAAFKSASSYVGQYVTGEFQLQLDLNLRLFEIGAQSLKTSCSNLWSIVRGASQATP